MESALKHLKEMKADFDLIDRTPASTPQKLKVCCLRPGLYAAKALLRDKECTFAIIQLSKGWAWICSDDTYSTPVRTLREAKEQVWNYIKEKCDA